MACGCGCGNDNQLSGYSPDSQNFLSGVGALPKTSIIFTGIIGVTAFLIGGKMQSGKWYWQKSKKRAKRRR